MANEELVQFIHKLVQSYDLHRLRDSLIEYPPADIADLLKGLSAEDTAVVFRILPKDLATLTFEYLDYEAQKNLFTTLGDARVATILNEMAPDDRTALLEEFPPLAARQLMNLLSKEERQTALTLLGYPESSVGRIMTPDYISIGENWSAGQVLEFIRNHGKESDTLNVVFVVDEKGKFISDVRLKNMLLAPLDRPVHEIMTQQPVALKAAEDQELAVQTFKKYDRTALPVIDSGGYMLGIVTIDDVLDIAEEEATEDIHKIGAVEALEDPYLRVPLLHLVRKRARWLVVLFVGELLTATAMSYFEGEIQRAVVLALFIPLIISSGGNSGSQAATLIIRALAIGEITLKDWWRVMRRELMAGFYLGTILGVLGFVRVALWSQIWDIYGPHWMEVGAVVGISLLGVVMWGVLTGAMLPLILKKLGADPATSSAPFVATLVDVTGLIIYFTLAAFILEGKLF
jgi:magnesium transporter